MKHWPAILPIILVTAWLGSILRASGAVTVFFDAAQTTNLVLSGTTSDTISSEGYLFTFTRDKLFTGGVGLTNPIGRMVRVPWPSGLEAQAVTAGPARKKLGLQFAERTVRRSAYLASLRVCLQILRAPALLLRSCR